MAWIESHQELRDHPKVRKLARLMKWDYCHALGHLQYFWLWCLQHALDGDLRKYDDEQIAEAAGVAAADAKNFVEAMVNCGNGIDESGNKVVSGFIDRNPFFRIHDWLEYAGRYLELRYRIADPEKLKHIQSLYRQSKDSLKTAHQTLPDLTKPNLTEPNQKKELKQERKVFCPPTAQEATAYAQSIGFKLDGEQFVAHYSASNWVRGKTKIVDWKACVVTWKKNQNPAPVVEKARTITLNVACSNCDYTKAGFVISANKDICQYTCPKCKRNALQKGV